jgi:hypothetical protein
MPTMPCVALDAGEHMATLHRRRSPLNSLKTVHRFDEEPVLCDSVRRGGMAEWSMAVVLKPTDGQLKP